MHVHHRIRACILMLAITATCLATEGEQKWPGTRGKRRAAGSTCGIQCLYLVLKASGADLDYRSLLRGEYIGSQRGSSLSELKKAAEDHGLHARVVARLTSRELRRSPCPVILHVKSEAASKEYDHYVLFTGCRNGRAQVLDPPDLIVPVAFHELAASWSGRGLVVSSEPVDLGVMFGPARKRGIAYATGILAAVLLVRRARHLPLVSMLSQRRSWEVSAAQGAGLAIAAFCGGMLYHLASHEGFLAHPGSTVSVQEAYLTSFIPKIGRNRVRFLLKTGVVVVDARFPPDYDHGHLQGAINIPIDANDVRREEAVAAVPKDAPLVVYCQSVRCKYAEVVAARLVLDGFSNISIFKGGWKEWTTRENKANES